ncbi:LicD family protein [Methanobrevibacter sp.]
MSFMEKILNRSNSYQYYKTNYELLKEENEKLRKVNHSLKKINKRIDKLEKVTTSHNELFNMIYVESNFKVGGNLRKLQLQTLEILKFVVSICEDYDFTYWLDYGTLLGAIRHGGYVPWDDEGDISMPRGDYEEFLKIIDDEIAKYPQLGDNVELRRGVAKLRHVKFEGIPAPGSQLVQVSPLANVDVHPIDYYKTLPEDENELLHEYDRDLFRKHSKSLREKIASGEYENFTQASLVEGPAVDITMEKTNFMGSPIDGPLRNPIHVSEIFPLKKITFEGFEFNCPNNPVKYLNTYYKGDLMKMPSIYQNHHRVELIRSRIPDEELADTFSKVMNEWESINSPKWD